MSGLPLTYDQWVQRATTDAVPPNSDGVLHVGERAALIEQLSYLKKRNAQLVNKQRAVLLAACEAQAAHAQCADFAGELMREKLETEARDAKRAAEPPEGASVRSDTSARSGSKSKTKKLMGMLSAASKLRKKRDPTVDAAAKGGYASDSDRSADGTDTEGPTTDDGRVKTMTANMQRLEQENSELLRKTSVLVDYVRATAPMPNFGDAGDDDDLYSDDDYGDDDDDINALPPRDGAIARSSCLPEPVLFDEFAGTAGQRCKWDSFVSGIVSAFGTRGSSFPEDDRF